MIGKKIRINDYKFTYGKEVMYVNVYGAFKSGKSGNKYVIYSYIDDVNKKNKLYYGSVFVRNNELVVMLSKDTKEDSVKEFTTDILSDKNEDNYEIISLKDIDSIQIIDDAPVSFDVDINKLYDKTMPKVKVTKKEDKTKKRVSIGYIFLILFIIVVALFFFVNPEVLKGKDKEYTCTKSYTHEKLPANINEKVELVFTSKNVISTINITSDYVFNDTDYYKEFRDNSYFYQYIEKGDTYKFDDDNYTYRLFSKIDTSNDYFMPSKLEELLTYYKDKGYSCKENNIE